MKPYRVSLHAQNGLIFNGVIMADDAKSALAKAVSLIEPGALEQPIGQISLSLFEEKKAFFVVTK